MHKVSSARPLFSNSPTYLQLNTRPIILITIWMIIRASGLCNDPTWRRKLHVLVRIVGRHFAASASIFLSFYFLVNETMAHIIFREESRNQQTGCQVRKLIDVERNRTRHHKVTKPQPYQLDDCQFTINVVTQNKSPLATLPWLHGSNQSLKALFWSVPANWTELLIGELMLDKHLHTDRWHVW